MPLRFAILLVVAIVAGCAKPPPLPYQVVETEVVLASLARITSIHVRGDYARAQGVDYTFVPRTQELDKDAIARNDEFFRLSSTDEAGDFMLDRVREGLASEFAAQAAEVGTTGRPVKMRVVVNEYDYNLGNAAFGAAFGQAAFGVRVVLPANVAYSDRTATTSGIVFFHDPTTDERIVGPVYATGRVNKIGLRVPGFEAVNEVMVRHFLKDLAGKLAENPAS